MFRERRVSSADDLGVDPGFLHTESATPADGHGVELVCPHHEPASPADGPGVELVCPILSQPQQQMALESRASPPNPTPVSPAGGPGIEPSLAYPS